MNSLRSSRSDESMRVKSFWKLLVMRSTLSTSDVRICDNQPLDERGIVRVIRVPSLYETWTLLIRMASDVVGVRRVISDTIWLKTTTLAFGKVAEVEERGER